MLAEQIRSMSDQVNTLREIQRIVDAVTVAAGHGCYSAMVDMPEVSAAVNQWIVLNGFKFVRVSDLTIKVVW
jgi:hypothetical protein